MPFVLALGAAFSIAGRLPGFEVVQALSRTFGSERNAGPRDRALCFLNVPVFSHGVQNLRDPDEHGSDHIREVAEYLKLTEKNAYRLAPEGTIPGFKVEGAWRFRKGDIDA